MGKTHDFNGHFQQLYMFNFRRVQENPGASLDLTKNWRLIDPDGSSSASEIMAYQDLSYGQLISTRLRGLRIHINPTSRIQSRSKINTMWLGNCKLRMAPHWGIFLGRLPPPLDSEQLISLYQTVWAESPNLTLFGAPRSDTHRHPLLSFSLRARLRQLRTGLKATLQDHRNGAYGGCEIITS